MTEPREVTVSDAECDALENWLDLTDKTPYWREKTRQALAAFLAARVPDANGDPFLKGHDYCRDRVLKGV